MGDVDVIIDGSSEMSFSLLHHSADALLAVRHWQIGCGALG